MGVYLRGTGTQQDPYVISTREAACYFFSKQTPGMTTNAYFDVVNDIDCGGYTKPSDGWESETARFNAKLNMNGHTIKNINFSEYSWYASSVGSIKNGCIDATYYYGAISVNGECFSEISNVKFIVRGGTLYKYSNSFKGNTASVIKNVVIDVISGKAFGRDDTGSIPLPASCYLLYPATVDSGFNAATKLAGIDRYEPSNYPLLDRSKWVMDGVSSPSLIKNNRPDLTTGFAIKGVTRVGNSRKSRNVTILSGAYRRPIWEGKSDEEGKFFAPLYDYYDAVIPLIFDDYGYPLKKDASYIIGDVVHPSTPNGYRYICEQAGISGPTLPVEPWSVEVLLTTGTAKFRPYPVYEPKCLGPMYPAKVNLITGEKV